MPTWGARAGLAASLALASAPAYAAPPGEGAPAPQASSAPRALPPPAPAPAPAAPPAAPPHPEALRRGTWITGLGGHISTSGESWQSRTDPGTVSRVDSGLDVRVGLMLTRRLAVGLDFLLEHRSTRVTARSIGTVSTNEESLVAGPWFRFYVPTDARWSLFFDAAWGFQHTVDATGSADDTSRLYGLSLAGGIGATYFVTPSVAFDASLYMRGAHLFGRTAGERSVALREDLGVRVGFQLYLPEFLF